MEVEVEEENKKHWGGKIIKIVEEGIKTLRRENNKIVEKGIKNIEEGNKIEKGEGYLVSDFIVSNY